MIPDAGSFLYDLVRIYSPTGKEVKVADALAERLAGFSADSVYKDSVGNVMAIFHGEGPHVLVCGHMDTVPGRLPVTRKGDIITGRGAVDAKGPLVSLLLGSERAKRSGFRGEIIFASVIGEEGPSKGIHNISEQVPVCDYAIFGEPSNGIDVTVGYRGRILLRLSFKSDSYHASAPWMGSNAVDTAIKAWKIIKEKYGDNRDFAKVSVGLTRIRGGKADNMTPANCDMVLDIRYPPSRKEDELTNEILTVISSGIGIEGWDHVIVGNVRPYVSAMKSEIIQCFSESVLEETGKKPPMLFKSGSGDMNILGSKWKIPAITFGPGNPRLSHTSHEEISITEVEKTSKVVCNALLKLQKHWDSNSHP